MPLYARPSDINDFIEVALKSFEIDNQIPYYR